MGASSLVVEEIWMMAASPADIYKSKEKSPFIRRVEIILKNSSFHIQNDCTSIYLSVALDQPGEHEATVKAHKLGNAHEKRGFP